MKLFKQLFFLSFLIFYSNLLAQNTSYDNDFEIKDPGKKRDKICGELNSILRNKPKEIGMGVDINENNEISIHFNDKDFFQRLITDKKDAISIDIVTKQQFACGRPNSLKNGYSNFGYLMKPIYKQQIDEKSFNLENGILIEFGQLPSRYDRQSVEPALVLIKKNYACYNQSFRSLERHRWNILEMGLFLDTLSESTILQHSINLDKTLKFEIPFEKDQAKFNPEDIKPLYDSLNLTDFNIKKINIIAYTSVEGSTEHNINLQNERAKSIVNALQSYQSLIINQEIDARENWVEFFEDISKTGYKSFTSYSKNEIKDKLSSKLLLNELEPILSQHRKAIIEIELEKKYHYEDKGKDELIHLFHRQIEKSNLERAKEIQKVIFNKIVNQDITVDLHQEITIPNTSFFGVLKNNHIAFSYFYMDSDLYTTIAAFEDLLTIIPNSYQVRYNLIALKLKAWIMSDVGINEKAFYKEIMDLKKYGIEQKLINRLLINYHIIFSEYMLQARKYADKDWSVKQTWDLYSTQSFTNDDILRLAQYFAFYSHGVLAEKIIAPRIFDLDADEDLLFYYISLTIYKYEQIGEQNYRKLLLNAVNANPDRFCELFNPSHAGGINMLFLAYDFYKDQYCENCQ